MLDALTSVSLRGTAATAGPSAAGTASTRAVAEGDFSNILADISGQAISSLKGAETTAISGIQGKASVQQVVQTIMAAEETLQTALAVRDKVVAAYQEISRLAI
ncbi:flagellar hook-basal body complex protein FliE [Ancylobacter dichloromethanicus]|nr:flagellar hook-basal body complex protein FliE [Ancylobacter dichloromethanicus]MBS7556303.1 flagellar hook-basal body complex protein FliE [Ancylobacter dichloromethanicus]